jgi:uncharacterized protein YdhG (YjbR/CyaY superfamily)
MSQHRELKSDGVTKSKIRAYIAALPPDTRRIIKMIRETIVASAPGATEHFSYGIPGFRFDGKPLMWYAGWKQHVGMYPMTATVKRANAAGLNGYEVSKGTVRFPLAKPPSAALIKRLIKTRIAEIRKQSKA